MSMRILPTILLLCIVHTLHAQAPKPGSRIIRFYDNQSRTLDSSNKHRNDYKIYISTVDGDGNKTEQKKQQLSKNGTWGGYFEKAPSIILVRITKGTETMNITMRQVLSTQFILDGIQFMKGDYEADFYSPSDSLLQVIHMDHWWNNHITEKQAIARSQILQGKVVAADNGDPLPFVTVLVKGSNAAVMTDANGNFKFDLSRFIKTAADSTVLQFSYVGYNVLEIMMHRKTLPSGQVLRVPMKKSPVSYN